LAVKDNISTTTTTSSPTSTSEALATATTTTCASRFLSNYRAPIEATVVSQLRARGAIVTAKTNLDEFGMGSHSVHSYFGPVAQTMEGAFGSSSRVHYSAGGSSGGSAVAVQTGEVDLALGTDTGGSVRLPAAYTGVVGYKPSYGMISRYGVVPYANSLDTVGFLARSTARIADLVTGKGGLWREDDPKDPTSIGRRTRQRLTAAREGYGGTDALDREGPLRGMVFGWPVEYNIAELEGVVRKTWLAAAKRLHSLGARVVPVSLPTTRHALSAYYIIAPAEASSNLAKFDGVRYGQRAAVAETQGDAAGGGVLYAASRSAGFGKEVKRRILLGSYTLSSEAMDNYFLKAQAVRRLVRRDFDRVLRLENPLVDEQAPFDLSDMAEQVPLDDKRGPAQVDFLLCPTAPTRAPKLEDVEKGDVVDAYTNDVFTVPASLAGLPAISIPVAVPTEKGQAGFVGLQLIGQYWDDARLLKAAGHVMAEVRELELSEGVAM